MNTLYYGDNLEILRRYIDNESVDLIYLDPPFKSNQDYNVLFQEQDGSRSAAQILAFGDTWQWDITAAAAYREMVEKGGRLSEALQAFRRLVGDSDMLAYISMMAPRLVELRRVLKPTGSIYLHCDPTASHYLKLLMDAIFGPQNCRNEIIWKRTFAHGGASRWGDVHDTLLFYTKSDTYNWSRVMQAHDESYLERKYRFSDERGKYRLVVLTGPGTTKGASGQAWHGYDPTVGGRHWAVPGKALAILESEGVKIPSGLHDQLDLLYEHGLIRFPEKAGGKQGVPEFKMYLPAGQPIQDVICDVYPINSQAQERLGYPTQKPTALLDRIVMASSNEGDTVLDPFCGCGTAVESAEKLGRNWIGIDITHLAITLIKHRLNSAFGGKVEYKVIGEPVSLPDAQALAREDRFQFQYWALGLVGARPTDPKRGADQGIDGRLYFHDDNPATTKQIVISVKSGGIPPNHIRELRGVVDREKAAIGLLITLTKPTKPMRAEAADAGFYISPFGNTKHPRIQILTIEELFEGKGIDCPRTDANVTFKRARRVRQEPLKSGKLAFE